MSYGKVRLKVLCLSLLVTLAFSAIAASGAQASKWFINNAAFHGSQTFAGSGGAAKLLSIGVNIECAAVLLAGQITALVRGLVTVRYTGCKVLEGSPLKLSDTCAVTAPLGDPGSEEILFNAKFTAFLHSTESWVLFEPDIELKEPKELNERTFTTINIVDDVLGSELCVLGGPKAIKGTQVALILSPATETLTHEIHVISDTVRQTLFAGDFLHIGANLATLDTASAKITISQSSGHKNWSFR